MKPMTAAEPATSRNVPDRHKESQLQKSLDGDKMFKMYIQRAKFDAGLAMIINRELASYRRLGEKVSRQKDTEKAAALQVDAVEPILADAAMQSDFRFDVKENLQSRRGVVEDFQEDMHEKQTATWIADDSASQRELMKTAEGASAELDSVANVDRWKQLEDTPSSTRNVDEAPIGALEDEPSVIEARVSKLKMIREMLHPDEETIRRKLIATEEDLGNGWAAESPDAPIFADNISPMDLQRYFRYQTGMLMGKERVASIDEEAVRKNLVTDEDELASNWHQFQLKKTRSFERGES